MDPQGFVDHKWKTTGLAEPAEGEKPYWAAVNKHSFQKLSEVGGWTRDRMGYNQNTSQPNDSFTTNMKEIKQSAHTTTFITHFHMHLRDLRTLTYKDTRKKQMKAQSNRQCLKHLLCPSNDTFKSFKFCFLAFLGTNHGSLDSYKLSVNITKLQSNLSSDICFVGNL